MQDHVEEKMAVKAEEEENMDADKANKPTNQDCFHGSNEHTNGSHGKSRVFCCCFDPINPN